MASENGKSLCIRSRIEAYICHRGKFPFPGLEGLGKEAKRQNGSGGTDCAMAREIAQSGRRIVAVRGKASHVVDFALISSLRKCGCLVCFTAIDRCPVRMKIVALQDPSSISPSLRPAALW